MKILTKTELKEMFLEGEVNIQFIKKNGELRNLRGTLNPQFLPIKELSAEIDLYEDTLIMNDDLLSVWDLDKKEYRTFKISSMKNINGVKV